MGLKRIAVAMGVGYVLGAKAGERRYAQIKEFWARTGRPLFESPSMQRIGQLGKEALGRMAEAVASQAQSGGQHFMPAARDPGGQRWAAAVFERGRVD